MSNILLVGYAWIHTGTHEISYMRCVKDRMKQAEGRMEK